MNELRSGNIYEHYFEGKKKTIEKIIMTLVKSNKTIAVWGAGERGIAFLNVYDPRRERIHYVFDKNEKNMEQNSKRDMKSLIIIMYMQMLCSL